MKYKITTNYAPLTLCVKVTASTPTKVYLRVYDAQDKTRRFTDRYKTVTGEEMFYIRMPLSPDISVVEVTGANGAQEGTFNLVSVTKKPLERRIDVNDIGNSNIRSFVKFAQKFSFNLGNLETNTTYRSDDGMFLIQLVPKIQSRDGRPLATPARIGRKTGIIQVSKSSFEKFTIPMRLAILLHEFSHFYLNEQIDNEMEADLNGLLIYLGLGYPRIEAYQAFLETFKDSPSALNKQRYDIINKFINDFESMNMVIQ